MSANPKTRSQRQAKVPPQLTARSAAALLEGHRRGTGAVTTRRAFEQGIGFSLARMWTGTRKLERQIKARGPSNYCPLWPRRRTGRESAPSNLIGAKGSPWKMTVKGEPQRD